MTVRRTRADGRSDARARLLRAALKLLVRQGYDATTMQAIVAEAATSIGNAYFYFGSKERLVSEAVATAVDELLAESERVAERAPPGPARIAALVANNVGAVLAARRGLGLVILSTDQRLGTIQLTEQKAIAVLVRQLAASVPSLDERERPFAAAAIFGANRTVLQRILRGELALAPADAVRLTVGWALRALGVPESERRALVDALPA